MSVFANEEYTRWLNSPALSDEERAELRAIEGDAAEIESRFFAPLEFGTAGLRGIMGAGLNRMNVHVVRWATQAFAEVILAQYPAGGDVAVCHDSRHNSRAYAEAASRVLAANGLRALLFDDMRPTPELSFAVREYGCAAGINITASHNTSEYNGYKAYGANGAQLSPRDADGVAEKMRRNDIFMAVKDIGFEAAVEQGLIKTLGAETDELFLGHALSAAYGREHVAAAADDFRVVFTPFHGTGRDLVPEALRRLGVKHVFPVPEQMIPDGDFPTVKSPNPEYPEAFNLAVALAESVGADIIIGTDPDADRIALLARRDGKYIHISGNSTGALLIDYYIGSLRRANALPANPAVLKTIVTTELARDIALAEGVNCYDTFTGFKFLAERKDELESSGAGRVILSYEESYGYMLGDFVRDKDAVTAAVLLAEMAAYYKGLGMALPDALDALYKKYGYRNEATVNLLMPGVDGLRDMRTLMARLRNAPPPEIAGGEVVSRRDYLAGTETAKGGAVTKLGLSGSDVLRFDMEDGTAILVRPSGTEPKLKVYILARGVSAVDCANKTEMYKAWATAINN